MVYSVVVDGKVLDYKFKPWKAAGVYSFFIDDIRVGSVHRLGSRWTAVGITPNKMQSVSGFATRLDACEYLLKLEGYTHRDWSETDDWIQNRADKIIAGIKDEKN